MSTVKKLDPRLRMQQQMRKTFLRLPVPTHLKATARLAFLATLQYLKTVRKDSSLTGRDKERIFARGARDIQELMHAHV